ncbi:DUF192 domain-containing protein [Winogradskyella maritima]|uniref:DUF192 domain-containing protein n=1 Tax=Winogradskyella maritima TaxID=1517766 RepID=A0ABV8ANI4_9FLAO|nr:DUF192 domain-containing protein [Winogradskyella maritima]
MKRAWFHIGILALSVLSWSCKDESKSRVVSDIKFTHEANLSLHKAETDSIVTTLDIEIADDEYQTQTGLMYRNMLQANHGMLFIFPDEAMRSFYMKNTRIPLDIIYFDADSTLVSIQKNAVPFNETGLPSEAPAKFVLEVNAGLTDEWQLEVGDKIKLSVLD